ncbi:MAG: hypothetical protein EOP45_06045 [Sphingobacteriaceae bacterium]|nr:MAG: hypothetical protein EOP45_06045 [Sphingobacteriaceae bacterium]
MIKINITIGFLILGLNSITKAQIVVEDAKGQSSVVLKNSNLSLDLGATAASFSINNVNSKKFAEPSQTFWGVDVRGELNEGLSTLISGGHVTPGSKLSGFLAHQFSVYREETRLFHNLRKLEEAEASKYEIDKAQSDLIDFHKGHKQKRILIFVSPFLNANTFRRYDSTKAGNLNNRFPKEKFRGGGVDVGINYIIGGRWQLGIATGIERTNSIDSLQDRKSTVRTTTNVGNQTIINDKEYTVKDGTYTTYNRFNLRTDILYYGSLDESYRFVWNTLYSRWYKPISNKGIINNVVVLGSGLNLYKRNGKLAGGIYVQCYDVGNTISNESNLLKRIDFGVTAKYAFSSIFF